ncbi:peroxiredoxin [filamentous cyanobacterium CCT1]|nr:peroxiredoxin [filamentous cyanobacterium CCT1]PSN79325.1 peroxiredoxin [filamentous cyanobacterium CCP4]
MAIRVGDAAPDFTLPNQKGESVTLSSYQGQRAVVLYFYPKDDTPGCTVESCSFRDSYEDFVAAGAEVIGISSDSPDSHRLFASKHNLPFTLVSDANGAVRKAYGVPATLGLLPGRVTYVIDREGVVRHIFNSQFNPKGHVAEAMGILKTLQAA